MEGTQNNMLRVRVCAAHISGFLGPKLSKKGPFLGKIGKELSKMGSFLPKFIVKVGMTATVCN